MTRFFKNSPRIEFETELNDIPNLTVVVAEFPLAQTPVEIRRGIPFGFSRDDSTISGIVPAMRWSGLHNARQGRRGAAGSRCARPRNQRQHACHLSAQRGGQILWLHQRVVERPRPARFEYALFAHDEGWSQARVPHMAWEYNAPVIVAADCQPVNAQSFVQTSDNVIVEAMRRDGADIEMRLVEAFGHAGTAEVKLNLPHTGAALTDLTGGHAQTLDGGPDYKFPVKPQQIVTLRFRTETPVPEIQPLMQWDELVPTNKLLTLHEYLPNVKGHPPRGS